MATIKQEQKSNEQKTQKITSFDKNMDKLELPLRLVGIQNGSTVLKNSLAVAQNAKPKSYQIVEQFHF